MVSYISNTPLNDIATHTYEPASKPSSRRYSIPEPHWRRSNWAPPKSSANSWRALNRYCFSGSMRQQKIHKLPSQVRCTCSTQPSGYLGHRLRTPNLPCMGRKYNGHPQALILGLLGLRGLREQSFGTPTPRSGGILDVGGYKVLPFLQSSPHP